MPRYALPCPIILLVLCAGACSTTPASPSDGGPSDAAGNDGGALDAGADAAGFFDAGAVDAGGQPVCMMDAGADAGADAGSADCAQFGGYYLYELGVPCQGHSRSSAAACVAQTGCQITVSTPEGSLSGTATLTSFTASVGSPASETVTGTLLDGGTLSLHSSFSGSMTACDDRADPQGLPLGASNVCCDVAAQSCGQCQVCSIVEESVGNPRTTACIPLEGLHKLEDDCTRPGNLVGYDDCATGLFCSQLGLPDSFNPVCRALCRSDDDCKPDDACSSLGSSPPGGVCLPSCAFFGTACLSGTTCRLQRSLAAAPTTSGVGLCLHVGTLGVGDVCAGAAQCPANTDCVKSARQTQSTCQPYCDTNHPCQDPTKSCVPETNTRAGVTVGVCLPT
jgi:hypothetical protein